MAMGDERKIFDPNNFIDRKAEQEIFQKLIQCQDDARLLTICDDGGRGKSHLLKQLQYNCIWQFGISVAMIELQALEDPTDFHLVKRTRDELVQVSPQLKFTVFDNADQERLQAVPIQIVGGVDLRDAEVSGTGNRFAGVQIENFVLPPQTSQVSDKEMKAREKCVSAFFDDIRRICDTEKVVILFDTWDKCNSRLQGIILNFLRLLCFNSNSRPAYLIFVLAGRKKGFPPFNEMLGANYHKIVRSIESFGEWDEDHVRAFLQVNGYEQIRDAVIQFICSEIKAGMTLIDALTVAKVSPKQ